MSKKEIITKTILTIMQIIGGAIAFFFGGFMLMFDGVCMGGAFCSRMPSGLAFLGAILLVLSVSQFFLTSKSIKRKSIVVIITLILAIILYGWRVIEYNHYKSHYDYERLEEALRI